MKRITNLYREAIEVAGVTPDVRWKTWLKRVDSVDRDKKDGYAFEGPFIHDQTDEVEVRPAVFLLADTQGSRKYQNTTYYVLVMDEAGQLQKTDIRTDNNDGRERGWALHIRDQVADLVDRMLLVDHNQRPALHPAEVEALLEKVAAAPGPDNVVEIPIHYRTLAILLDAYRRGQ